MVKPERDHFLNNIYSQKHINKPTKTTQNKKNRHIWTVWLRLASSASISVPLEIQSFEALLCSVSIPALQEVGLMKQNITQDREVLLISPQLNTSFSQPCFV